MTKKFQSGFKDIFENYFEFRKAMGYTILTEMGMAHNLDCYVVKNFPTKNSLDADVVLGWLDYSSLETPISYLGNRATFARNIARFIIACGDEAYILPEKYVSEHRNPSHYLFTDAEMTALFHAIDSDEAVSKFEGILLSTLLRLIFTCGLRPGEGLRLLRSDIVSSTGEIKIRKTKNRKERIVVMSDDMNRLLMKYLKVRDAAYPDSDYVFPSKSGKPFDAYWLQKKFKRYFASIHPELKKEELPRVRVYDLRHMFASKCVHRWINEGTDINTRLPYLMSFMGHGSLNETEYYIHILPETLLSSTTIDYKSLNAILPEVSHDELN